MLRRRLLVLLGISVASASRAQLVVFDPTNYVQTTITAAQSVLQVTKMIERYALQLQQYMTQLQQLKSLSPSSLLGLITKNAEDIRIALQVGSSLKALYGSVEQVRSTFSGRLNEAKLLGLSWDKYAAYEQKRIDRNVQGAVDRAREELRVMERVKRDLDYAREMEAKIPASAGIHESMQQVNAQMNRVLAQGADMARMMSGAAQASGLAVEAAQQENERDQLRLEQLRVFGEIQKAKKAGEAKAVVGLP
jgi:type IV secretion system protein TrbJ